MFLQNYFYSNINLYLKTLNEYLLSDYELKAEYKTYDKPNGDEVTFTIFNIKSILQNKINNFVINQLNYEGNLTFIYDKLTNKVLIKELPIINYNNKIKLPVFTQDLATIVMNQLSRYIDQEEIDIIFEKNLNVIAIDETVKDVIPSIKNTINYKILNVINETISKEIKKIEQDIANHKAHYDRLTRSKERAINKKRIILGVNPLSYQTQEKFSNELDERLRKVFTVKYNNIKRHLELSEKKYKKLLDNEKLEDYFIYIFGKYIIYERNKYSWENKEELPLEFQEVINNIPLKWENISPSNWYSRQNNFKNWLDESKFFLKYKEDFINAVYNYDLYNEKGALSVLKIYINEAANKKSDIRLGDLGQGINDTYYEPLSSDFAMKGFCVETYGLPQAWLWPTESNYDFKYHPIFYDKTIDEKVKNELRHKENASRCLKIIEPFYKSENFKSGFNLLQQITKLIEKEKTYREVIINPELAILDFRTFSANWGNIINLPYWYISDKSNHTTRGGYIREGFTLFVIKPGILNIDFSKIRGFVRNEHNTLKKGYYNPFVFEQACHTCNCNRLAITIPKSLNYDAIKEIINKLKYEKGEFNDCDINRNINDEELKSETWLNIICESFDKYLFIKEYLMKKLINGDILSTRIFVNCDPEYYDNYLVETPTNEVFWHKYDFLTSDYKYRRKYLLDLRGQFNYAKEYLHDILGITPDNSEYKNILEEILLGSYSSSPKYEEYIKSFKEYLFLKEIEILNETRNYTKEELEEFLNSEEVYAYQDFINKYKLKKKLSS